MLIFAHMSLVVGRAELIDDVMVCDYVRQLMRAFEYDEGGSGNDWDWIGLRAIVITVMSVWLDHLLNGELIRVMIRLQQ